MCEIEDIKAIQILDSRGNPTVEVEVYLTNGACGRASVPSGASTGMYEAIELRDNITSSFMGKSVFNAIDNINDLIAPNLIGENVFNQQAIDSLLLELDGTFNKSNLGANAILGVSLGCAKAACNSLEIPLYRYLGGIIGTVLPTPMINIINGGVHTNNNLDFQEFMISPIGFSTFSEALKASVEIFHTLKKILENKNLSTNVGDEGGFAPELNTPEQAIELIINAIEQAGYTTKLIKICLDVAASEFFNKCESSSGECLLNNYYLKGLNQNFSTDEMIDYLEYLVNTYPIISIEDGLSENDWDGWIELTKRLEKKCQIVGDDLFVTNISRIKEGLEKHVANSVLIKPNQVGTLSETINSIIFAKENGYSTIISHRSGETEDNFIADLAVSTNSGLIKTGSLSRTDRLSKYNQLLRIENDLGIASNYAGSSFYKPIINNKLNC